MPHVTIRPYKSGDRDDVFRLAADTAFFGNPVEDYLDDRKLFCDSLYRYYTDLEPQHCWVASANDEVVGFLTGCVDVSVQRRLWVTKILPHIALGLVSGRYKIGALTWQHFKRLARHSLRIGSSVDTSRYPANLHLNVRAAWRGRRLGQRLLEAYLSQLRALQIPGVHLNTTNLNAAACKLFEKMGFKLAAIQPAPQWAGLVSEPVFKRTYVLDLSHQL